MTHPLAIPSAPTDSAFPLGCSLKPEAGVVSPADAGFGDVLSLCAAPVVADPVAALDPLATAVISHSASPRSWGLDPVGVAEEDFSDDDDQVEVPAEILALAVPPPPLAVPAELPPGAPGRTGYASGESSPGSEVANGVTDFPLHSRAVADAEMPAVLAPEAGAVVDPAEPTEEFAATTHASPDRAGAAVGGCSNNKFLKSEAQRDARRVEVHGTGRAKSSSDMPATSDSIPDQPVFAPSRAGGLSADAIPSVAPTTPATAAATVTSPPVFNVEVAERREVHLSATDATAVVREVVELTHEFRLRERGSVEVKFDFQDATELSVRLAYRDGDVHATFRTDSEELRAALGREWPGFAANVAREPGAPRIAEPVFSASGDLADSPPGHDSGSPSGGDSRERWQASRTDESGFARTGFSARPFRPHVPARGIRVSSDRLLHAFA